MLVASSRPTCQPQVWDSKRQVLRTKKHIKGLFFLPHLVEIQATISSSHLHTKAFYTLRDIRFLQDPNSSIFYHNAVHQLSPCSHGHHRRCGRSRRRREYPRASGRLPQGLVCVRCKSPSTHTGKTASLTTMIRSAMAPPARWQVPIGKFAGKPPNQRLVN